MSFILIGDRKTSHNSAVVLMLCFRYTYKLDRPPKRRSNRRVELHLLTVDHGIPSSTRP